jgi:hypothetical protein
MARTLYQTWLRCAVRAMVFLGEEHAESFLC